jgi:NifU-like protein involved in Fe-S cluster formation/bacterioferritin-associated ferredoxin
MSFYPTAIRKRLRTNRRDDDPGCDLSTANTSGTSANFDCGSFVSFDLSIDPVSKTIVTSRFRTNGCGFMVAAAGVLAEIIVDKYLTDLHGLDRDVLESEIARHLGAFPLARVSCGAACIEAMRAAFAVYRKSQIGEYSGEKALICTCFGIAEETVEDLILNKRVNSIEDVGEICNAGRGCGSCRMLIQEMLDTAGEFV